MNSVQPQTSVWPPARAEAWEPEHREMLAGLARADLPRHIAVIMDGNGRWAKNRGLVERIRGHEAGIESVREITRTCRTLEIGTLTLYAFSKENWERPRFETTALMELLRRFSIDERGELMENGIRLLMIGDADDLPRRTRAAIDGTIKLTRDNTAMTLVLALSYGARDEMVRGVRKLAGEVAAGRLDAEAITPDSIDAALDTAGTPDPDLLIRTSGEQRISNFLLWQIAYSEILVTPVLWPDFRRGHLLEALTEYKKRERRFGRVDDLG